VSSEKQRIREKIWRMLEEEGVARFPKPIYGRIPNFEGAEEAASRILRSPEYVSAEVVKVGPDSPQRYIRYRCLVDEKIMVMPTPRLREGFLLLDPSKIPKERYDSASTIRGAFIYGERVRAEDLPRIDLVVVGSVAVARDGLRIGKGGGYGELEYAILLELGKIDPGVPIATNIHDLQLIDSAPRDPYDLTVDIIATPSRLIRVNSAGGMRPRGIIWEDLSPEKLEEIPLLKELAERRRRKL